MMGTVLGLGVGVGLLLIYASFAVPRRSPALPRPAGRLRGSLTGLLARAGLAGTSPRGVLIICFASAAVAGVGVQVLSRTEPVAVAFAVMAGYLPVAVLVGRARRRQRELAEVWPEAVDNLASAVRAGLSLPEALIQLGQRGPEPLRDPFLVFALDYQVTGRFTESLDRLKERLSDPVGDRVVEGLRIAREVGGGELGRLLRSLSGYLREDARTRSELESRQSWTVNGARLAVAAPWLVLLMLCFQRQVIARYSSPAGVIVLVVGAVACLVAYRLMVRIGRLPQERRVLS
ncbi:MAG: Flp pilus assembly protein TadB [uncultured Nocardioidaceae bacterium]|uniref:Flp pilus assembly protein TadB n=1 Tax=uncultured Nocardioidaceae bacterium TaxID=253824 RepID=A0A6J4LQZ5_9ACTN|nr:MAG: Flp pilus assembly protein TadB [uncultured Nocardioidaceae bacterium]